jgi:hypothetical protein
MPTIDTDAAIGDIFTLLDNLDIEETTQGTLDDLAVRHDVLMRSAAKLTDLRVAIELTLIDSMESDEMEAADFNIVRSRTPRSTWKPSGAARMREDMKHCVANAMSTDIETGEVNVGRRNLINSAIDDLFTGVPSFSSIKVDARQRWDLKMGDYREYSDAYSVKILPKEITE